MFFKYAIFLLSFLIYVEKCLQKRTTKRNITIGVFLDENDNLTEMALNNAIHVINILNGDRIHVHPFVYKIKNNDTFKTGLIMCELLEKGVTAIFGPNSIETNEIVQSMSYNLEIPQFQLFSNTNLDAFYTFIKSDKETLNYNKIFNFNLYPSPATLSQALATLVRENDWQTYAIIYENDDALIRLQEVLKTQNPTTSDSAVTFRKLGPGFDHRGVLKEVKASGVFRIILDCDTDHIMDILWQAKELKLLEEYHSYILTSLDTHILDFSQLGEIKANLTSIRLIDPENLREVVKDWEMSSRHPIIPPQSIRTKTVVLFDALNLFITSFMRVDLTERIENITTLSCNSIRKSNHGSLIATVVSEFGLKAGTQLLGRGLRGPLTGSIFFDYCGRRAKYQLQIIEKIKEGFRVTATWNSDRPHILDPVVTSEEREKEIEEQIKRKNFRVVSRIDAPYFSYRLVEEGQVLKGNDRFEGYAVDLIGEICKILNCTFTFEVVPDNKYGRYNEKTKEWDGLIRHLLDRKADLAVCDLTITYERRKAVDFSNPFMTLGISILYSKATKPPPELLAFTNPLSLDIWLYMATGYIIVSMIIFLVARMNPRDWENPHPCNPSPEELENIWTLRNCFWLTLGSIMAQGCDILPKGISTRMIASMWWFFSMIMTACYTANLAAFLTMERMGPSIDSAEDLASQTKIKYGCVKDGATASFFRDSNVSIYHKMWVQMESAEPSVFVNSNKDGVKRVLTQKRKYAFLMESTTIEYEMERNCELIQVGGWLDTKGYGIAMPINAPYRKNINHAILKMQESGILKKLKEKWWIVENKEESCKEDVTADEPTAAELGIAHVGGVFVVLAGGIGVALTMAVFEFLWSVKKIAVTNKLSIKEVLMQEIKFAMDIWQRKKLVKKTVDECIGTDDM